MSRRPKSHCYTCGGNYRTLGTNSTYVPHEEWCPRNPLRPKETRRLNGSPEQRFWGRVVRRDPDGCWEWDGAHANTGYAQLWDGERVIYAHRLSHELFIGPIPDGHEIDHLCRNRGCVNPKHLEAVTHQENGRRGHISDTCRNGHPRTPENWYTRSDGSRYCQPCSEDARRRRTVQVLHDPFECPDPTGAHCEEARRRAMYREGVRLPGLRPRSIPERYELVRPDQREPERPRVRTPDYGHDGLN